MTQQISAQHEVFAQQWHEFDEDYWNPMPRHVTRWQHIASVSQ